MKLSCLSSATRPGDKAYNEDALLLNDAFCGIFDGATSLTDSAPVMSNYPSDAAWFVEESKQYLELHLQDTSQTIQQLCQKAMEVCRSRWKGPISADAIPSAGFAAVRQNGTALECFCLGDVSLSVRLLSGAFLYFPEQELSLLDETALQAAIAYRKEGHSWANAVTHIRPLLQKHRRMRNQFGGYSALDLRVHWLNARTVSLPFSQIRSIFLCSDGFAQLIDFGIAKDLSDLHRRTEQEGVKSLLSLLTQAQQTDQNCVKVPRFKCMDDATAAILQPKDCSTLQSLL